MLTSLLGRRGTASDALGAQRLTCCLYLIQQAVAGDTLCAFTAFAGAQKRQRLNRLLSNLCQLTLVTLPYFVTIQCYIYTIDSLI